MQAALLFATAKPAVNTACSSLFFGPCSRHPVERRRCANPRTASEGRPTRSSICGWTACLETPGPARGLVLGVNQYSHDASVAVVDIQSGTLLFAMSKERITRRKHDAGDVAALVEAAMETVAAAESSPYHSSKQVLESIRLVVANNHHFRIKPFESALSFLIHAGYVPAEYARRLNLVGATSSSSVSKVELSHHLAHAYSAIRSAPFDSGLCLIMDGMGDNRTDWYRFQSSYSQNGVGEIDGSEPAGHYTDLDVPEEPGFRQFPPSEMMDSKRTPSYREAESVYRFRRTGLGVFLTRLFKRWTPEVSPSELYNHGFHDMQSVGAVYSRCATHIFGDWNSCGKVMGLAPCASIRDPNSMPHVPELLTGSLYDGSLQVNSEALATLPYPNQWPTAYSPYHEGTAEAQPDRERRLFYEALAQRVQGDLERVTIELLHDLHDATEEENLVFAGGVALNSTLNGRILRDGGFQKVHFPPYPGDEGVAVGCAFFGYEKWVVETNVQSARNSTDKGCANVALQYPPFTPYLGPSYDAASCKRACHAYSSWLDVVELPSTDICLQSVASELDAGSVVACFHGRGEFGPRALGNRSLLADPRRPEMVERLNKIVKRRESFRPFAPTCLDVAMEQYFGNACGRHSSPYMSVTSRLSDASQVPAVAHVDGTARVQTLSRNANPAYYDLIQAFRERTRVGMVLNTSFNVAGQPIVNSSTDAIRTFLNTTGIDVLLFLDANTLVRRNDAWPARSTDCLVSLAWGADFRSHVERARFNARARVTVTVWEGDTAAGTDTDGQEFPESVAKGGADSGDGELHNNVPVSGEHVYGILDLADKHTTEASQRGHLFADDRCERQVVLADESDLDLLEIIADMCEAEGSVTTFELFARLEEDGFAEVLQDRAQLEQVECQLERLWKLRMIRVTTG